MRKTPTTKELVEKQNLSAAQKRLERAKEALRELDVMQGRLQRLPYMGKLLNELYDHRDWLIAENESFGQAAAELYVEEKNDKRLEMGANMEVNRKD